MTTLMRNGRDRRSENPRRAMRDKERVPYWLGPISGSHQGQRPKRLHRDGSNPPSENRPDTWLHPNASLKKSDSSCTAGAVHTWPFATKMSALMSAIGAKRTWRGQPKATRMTLMRHCGVKTLL